MLFWLQREYPHCGEDELCPLELWSVGAEPTSALRLAVYPDVVPLEPQLLSFPSSPTTGFTAASSG